MSQASRRRGFVSWFVEPYRQVKLGLLFLILNLIFSAIILSVFGYYIWDIYNAVSSYFHLSPDQSQLAMQKFSTPVIVGILLIGLFVLTTILVSVKYTHQIYGPLVSIHRFLDNLLQNQYPESLQLRQSDQLKDLADKLNIIAEGINKKRDSSMIPVFKFLDDLIDGKNPAPLKLRDADQMNQLSEKLNSIAEKLEQGPK